MPSDKKELPGISAILFYPVIFVLVIFCIEYFGTIKNDFMLFERMQPLWLFAALISQIGTYYLNSRAYQLLLLAYMDNTIFSLKELFQISITMLFFNSTVPSVGLSGDTFFSKLLSKRGISATRSLAFILFGLLIVYLSRIVTIELIIFAGLFYHFPHSFNALLITGIIIYTLLSLLMVVAERKKVFLYIIDKLKRINFIGRKLEKYEEILRSEYGYNENPLKILISKRGIVSRAIACNVGISACDIFTIYAIFSGIGASVDMITVILGYILTQIITLVPTSPGSLLVYEGSMTYFFVLMGVSWETSITAVLLYRCLSFWLPIPVGFFLQKKLQEDI